MSSDEMSEIRQRLARIEVKIEKHQKQHARIVDITFLILIIVVMLEVLARMHI